MAHLRTNPFSETDSDRREIWDMLVRRDIAAFAACDWDAHVLDFAPGSFFAVDGGGRTNPDGWTLSSPDAYAEKWLSSGRDFRTHMERDALEEALFSITTLRDIEVRGDTALAHKEFGGWIDLGARGKTHLNWLTLYICTRIEGRWRISGFVGDLPLPMGMASGSGAEGKKFQPPSVQHVTAGPYSPVLCARPGTLVVISGQASLDLAGNVIGTEIHEQARVTLDNCLAQLSVAGCDFGDVFKVNVYMADLEDWPAFNEVYRSVMPEPLPVRTAIQAGLLETFRVEIEMWAIKP